MKETPATPPSSPSRRGGGGAGGAGTRRFSKSIFLFIFVAGLLTIVTWSHFLEEFYSYDELFKTASKATVESLEVMSLVMDAAVKVATDAAAAAAVTVSNENGEEEGNTSLQNEQQSTTNSASVTVERKATTISAMKNVSTSSKGLSHLTEIYEAIAKSTRHNGHPWPNPRKSTDTCQHYTVLTRHEYAKAHNITTTPSSSSNTPILTSSVEFIGCCGLGHRLSRMAGAAHIAHELETTFLSHWGCCQNTDVFYDLFGFDPILFGQQITLRPLPPPVNISTNEKPEHRHHLQFRFETPPFQSLKKHGVKCPCSQDKIDSDFNFFSTLRNRYTRKHEVDAFVQKHFYNRTSIGLHIRAGNGEQGDFAHKGRGISNDDEFVQNTIKGIHQLLLNATTRDGSVLPPPIVFIATDTPHFISDFRAALNGTMSVVELAQPRTEEGRGVLFGEFTKVTSKGDECMDGWHSAVQDQLILSNADIIMAAKTSSYTQSLPLSLATGRVQYPDSPHNQPPRRVFLKKPFCEGVPPFMTCFQSVGDWCCNTGDKKPTYHDVVPTWRQWV